MIDPTLGPDDELCATGVEEFKGEMEYHAKHAKRVTFNRPTTPTDNVEYEAIEAIFGDRSTCPWLVEVDRETKTTAIVFWTEDTEERFIGPRTNHEGQVTVDYQRYEVGDIVYWENGAPGVGHVIFRVDRKDEEGLWGLCIEDTRWIPDGEYYR